MGPAILGEGGTFENQTRSHRAVPTEQWSPVNGRHKQPSQQKVKFIRNSSRRNHEGWNSPETAMKAGQPCPVQLCKTANKKSLPAPKQFRPIAEVTQAKAGSKH